MSEPRDLADEAQDGHLAGLPNGQAGPAAAFRPSFPAGLGPQPDALAAVRAAIPPLRDVEQAGQVHDVVVPPAGSGANR